MPTLSKSKTPKKHTLMKKILVIINKNWETEPVLNALTNPKLRPAALPFPEVINTPRDGDFNEDVTDTQNYVSAFNGGLALSELLCALAEYEGEIDLLKI